MSVRAADVRLAWVLVDGQLQRVADFVGVPVRQRPASACPECERPTALKLGTRKAPHASHRTPEPCGATGPETALHLNAKFHLASALEGVERLEVHEACPSCGDSPRLRAWPARWDAVHVERKLGSRRPDITLLCGGAAVAAIEVFATNEVNAEKAADLARTGLPWLEVRAATVWGDEEPWSPRTPLPVHRSEPDGVGVCTACVEQRALRARLALEAEQAAAREAARRRAALAEAERAAARRRADEERADRVALAKLERWVSRFMSGPVAIGRTLFLTMAKNRAEWTTAVKVYVIRVNGESAATVLAHGFVRSRKPFDRPHWSTDTDARMDTPADACVLGAPTFAALAELDAGFGTLLERFRSAGIAVSANYPGDDLHLRPDAVSALVLDRA